MDIKKTTKNIKSKVTKKNNPFAKILSNPLFKPKVKPSGKKYRRKKLSNKKLSE